MEKKRKVLIVNDCLGVGSMFKTRGWTRVEKMENADLVQFTGGSDISPELYGDAFHPTTITYPARDEQEVAMMELALSMGKPIAGICRGAQLINALAGGKLWQDVSSHAVGGTHKLKDLWTGEVYNTTSTHHQMCIMTDRALVIAVTEGMIFRKEKMVGGMLTKGDPKVDEPEVFVYPHMKALGFQGHPEYSHGLECRDHYFRYIEDYLFNGE